MLTVGQVSVLEIHYISLFGIQLIGHVTLHWTRKFNLFTVLNIKVPYLRKFVALDMNLAPEKEYKTRFLRSSILMALPWRKDIQYFIPTLHGIAEHSKIIRSVSEVICGSERESDTSKGVSSQDFKFKYVYLLWRVCTKRFILPSSVVAGDPVYPLIIEAKESTRNFRFIWNYLYDRNRHRF